ncbi:MULTISPECIES: oligosaccharide flippase family protein [unclassified Acinetobacter]|uniref:oligosaccharide flippase family protein n=1 Tax=unclassified Acinetobacter TaxID=196816 RepID=UPI00300834CB
MLGLIDRKIFSNSFWMMFEKVISLFGLILVNAYVAKYLGPSDYGKIALVISIFTLAQTIIWFGNQEVLFKRVSQNQLSGLNYLFATQKIRKILCLLISFPILLWLYIFSDFLTFCFGIAVAISTFFIIQDIFVVYNNAILKSQLNVYSNILMLLIVLIIRYLIVEKKLSPYFFCLPLALIGIIPFFLKKIWLNQKEKVVKNKLLNEKKYTNYYLRVGSVLVVSSISVGLYTQINNLLLGKMISTYELGLYSVAVTLGVTWTFVNQSIITSYMTKIYKENNKNKIYKMMGYLNIFIVFISFFYFALIYFFGKNIINKLYGAEYLQSFDSILIIIFSSMLSSLGIIVARFMIKDGGYSFLSRKTVLVTFLSIPLSFSLIYYKGLIGAAWSMLVVEFLSLTFFNYFYKKGLIFKIQFFIGDKF